MRVSCIKFWEHGHGYLNDGQTKLRVLSRWLEVVISLDRSANYNWRWLLKRLLPVLHRILAAVACSKLHPRNLFDLLTSQRIWRYIIQ